MRRLGPALAAAAALLAAPAPGAGNPAAPPPAPAAGRGAGTMQAVLDFYARPGPMTSPGTFGPKLAGLPRDVGQLARAVQGVLLHDHWAPAYGVTLPDERRGESHLRPVEGMLARLLARDERPLATARPVEERLVGVCRHFSVLLVAILRAKGVPARARCGFGGYFTPARFEDHWVAEYWNAAKRRWMLVDAQLDALQRERLKIDFDPLDVPRDRFLIAGDAWAQCRAGKADPANFGLSPINERGLWFIAGNLVRDAAALNGVELLPWDVWGAMPGPDEPLKEESLAFFDRLAALTRDPDRHFAELRALYQADDRLRVPATVRNAIRNREEAIEPGGARQ